MSEKYGLVLEGGGVRGAYTAGALAWLNDEHITFDYGVGISSGAVYMCCYWEGDKHTPEHMSTDYAADKENVGIRAFLKEGYYVAYKHLFDDDLKGKEHMTIQPLKDMHAPIEVGSYDLDQGKTVFFTPDDMDDSLELLRGCCALPIASAVVKVNGHQLLDGGITKMIPIERSVEQGVTKHLIITTKPADYVRKPAPKAIIWLMGKAYKNYPQIKKDYSIRHVNYYKQIDLINQLVSENKAINIRPSVDVPVSRWKGDRENCRKLYDLGYSDMEARREEIYRFLDREDPKKITTPAAEEKVPA
ncbi:MAG: patatin family protein [Stecheria intestinalis]|nr:patatin family protein [Stecheria intestinalis]MDY4680501.1 patatin family protein [Lachnospiraceae bacterium]